MRMFFSKKKPVGNTRRTRKVVKPVRKPITWFKPLVQGLAVSMVVIVAGFGVWELNKSLSVSYWDIDADAHLKTQIESYLAEKKGAPFWQTRASVLRDELVAQIPDIQHIKVSRILPDGLLVQAQARIPMALWKGEQAKQVMLIDEKGVPYRALKRGETLDLPFLRVHQDDLKNSTQMLLALNKYDVRKLLNLSELIVSEQGWRLNFAKGEQWQVKSTNIDYHVTQIMNILDMPRWSKGHWRIDARIPERWFIRPAKQEVI